MDQKSYFKNDIDFLGYDNIHSFVNCEWDILTYCESIALHVLKSDKYISYQKVYLVKEIK